MQSTGNRTHHSWPALHVAILLTVGIVPGYLYGFAPLSPPLLAISLLICCLTLLIMALGRPKRIPMAPGRPGRIQTPLSLAGVAIVLATGVLAGNSVRVPDPSLPEEVLRGPVTVVGEVLDPPAWSSNALRFRVAVRYVLADTISEEDSKDRPPSRGQTYPEGSLYGGSKEKSNVLPGPISQEGVDTGRDPAVWRISVTTTVAIRIKDGEDAAALPEYGMTLALHGEMEPPRGPRNPGEFDAKAYYRTNGIDMLMTVRGLQRVCMLDSGGGWWGMRAIVVPVRKGLLSHIDRRIGGEEGEFLKGLMIGERGGMTSAMRSAFLKSGVAHILAVSGSNVAVVAAACFGVFFFLRVPRRVIVYPVACSVILYMLVTGSQPSVVRATIMALVGLFVAWRGIRGSALNAVGIAALIMYALDPRQVIDMGFQLSFGAVLSIILLYPRVNALLARWRGKTLVHRIVKGGVQLAVVSLVASVGTFPLTASAFGQASVVGLLTNIFVVPVSGWSVVLGLFTAVVEPLSGFAAESLSALNAVILWFTLRVVEVSAALPYAAFDTYWFEPVHALPFLGILLAVYHAEDPPLRRAWIVMALVSGNLAVVLPGRYEREPGEFYVSVIDVGQGDAILLEHPDGGTLLIDTGPIPFDERSGLVPFLKRRGIDELDLVVITHPHDDHSGGLPLVRRSMGVKELITHTTAQPGTLIPWKQDCRLQVLHAVARIDTVENPGRNLNRLSVVIRLVYGETAFIFAADAEHFEESRMIEVFGEGLKSAVLKVGHHGSRAATTGGWLDAVRPAYAIISVGRHNRFGHPSPTVLRRLRERGIAVLRTDEEGAVMMVSDGKRVRREEWRQSTVESPGEL